MSHPSRGAWIEMLMVGKVLRTWCRTPHGVRGLKYERAYRPIQHAVQSHPSRGAWIEMLTVPLLTAAAASHPSRGAWIEMILSFHLFNDPMCRTPHGVRGLKFVQLLIHVGDDGSHPSRGAWIEIASRMGRSGVPPSHPSRGAWIEIADFPRSRPAPASHPSRGAWIEIRLAASPTAPEMSHPSRGAWIEIHQWEWGRGGTFRRTPHGVRGLKSQSWR